MIEWRKRSKELCESCYYWRGFSGTSASCDYIGVEGHSRIFENGKRKPQTLDHLCDSYKPYIGDREKTLTWKEQGQETWKQRNIPIVLDAEED